MDERVGICVFVRKPRAEKMRRSVPRLKKGGVWSVISSVNVYVCVCDATETRDAWAKRGKGIT